MDAMKMKSAEKVIRDVSRVAMRHGYQADFSGLGEGKGVEFKMSVAFKKPVVADGKQMDLTQQDPEFAQ